ncbi:hypothetical protein C8J56DRAFT_927129 [Mycena floridula]|nr:hypothetical protein C8J56DRAFT_927129 [Mycena floridula]
MSIPSPVGGIVVHSQDFIPSIIFAVFHGLLVPVCIYRLSKKQTRTTLIIAVLTFVTERTIMFSLRATINPYASGFIQYSQSTLAIGYLALMQALGQALGAVFLEAATDSESTEAGDKESLSSNFSHQAADIKSLCRRLGLAMTLAFVLATAGGAASSEMLYQTPKTSSNMKAINLAIQWLRYISAGIAVGWSICMIRALFWASHGLPNVKSKWIRDLLILNFLLILPPLFRLGIMHLSTADYESPTNSALAKAFLYALHILPEWLSCVFLLTVNFKMRALEVITDAQRAQWKEWRKKSRT